MGVEVEVYVNPEAFRQAPAPGCITMFPQLQAINRLLQAADLPPYSGPGGGKHLCLRIGSYGTLSRLMYHAAELAVGPRPPVGSYYEFLVERYAELELSGAVTSPPPFQHLALHHDCDGYFVPIDFPRVLNVDGAVELPGRYLGSAVRLRAECEELADLHDFPLVRDPVPEALPGWPSHEEVFFRLYDQSTAPLMMITCAKLHYAACYSIRTGGLMLFS